MRRSAGIGEKLCLVLLLGLLQAGCAAGPEKARSLPQTTETHRVLADLGVTPRLLDTGRRLECVPYARRQAGIQIRGHAGTWWSKAKGRYARGRQPRVGSVLAIKAQGRSRGHLAVVTKILNEREILADHANWLNRGRIHKNTPIIDVSPQGDWSRVRVWYTPGQVYGKRRYAAHGFIHKAAVTAGITADRRSAPAQE